MAPGWPYLKSHHIAAEHHFPFPQGTQGTLPILVRGSELDQCEGVQGKTRPPNSRNMQMGDSWATGVGGSKGLLRQNKDNQLLPGANATPATQPSWEARQLQLQLATWGCVCAGCCSGSCKGMLVPPPPQQATGSSSLLIHLLVPPNPLPKGLTHTAPWQRPPRPASLLPLLPCKAPLPGCHTLLTFQRPVSILECSEPSSSVDTPGPKYNRQP